MEYVDQGQNHSPSGWVGGDEWHLHKGLIQELYLVQSMPLKDVMKVMEDQHGFRATSNANFPLETIRYKPGRSAHSLFDAGAITFDEDQRNIALEKYRKLVKHL
ncbi:hypothetical protein B0T24DRAFT_683648 [Lasiosphaeria ovina]|uniref:Clr5 domain-containing protein n=1 Tax=Lasiosphaeria ovina TaxID=92902 RepID=A0AAE0JVY4_9PEZI|nr:hypothetical protein B0T24DRAFT_683648 [Lasiosphaeria ovina]